MGDTDRESKRLFAGHLTSRDFRLILTQARAAPSGLSREQPKLVSQDGQSRVRQDGGAMEEERCVVRTWSSAAA